MPRKPNATSPNANTAGAIMIWPSPIVEMRKLTPINPVIASPIQ